MNSSSSEVKRKTENLNSAEGVLPCTTEKGEETYTKDSSTGSAGGKKNWPFFERINDNVSVFLGAELFPKRYPVPVTD